MLTKNLLAVAATLSALTGAAWAQAPTTPPAPPAHHGILGHLFHPHPSLTPGRHPGMAPGLSRPGGTLMFGKIIGNKKTHIYHVPGAPGALPSPANRVYFPNEAAAIRAGYRRAGQAHGAPGKSMHKTRGNLVPVGARP